MRLTLKSMETEMRSTFSRIETRFDSLELEMKYQFSEVHDRIDRLSLNLESHKKETAYNFRKIDERFNAVDERFDRMDERFDRMDERFDGMDERFDRMDERFDRMDERFKSLESVVATLPSLSEIMSEVTKGIYPWMNFMEDKLDNHDKRIRRVENDIEELIPICRRFKPSKVYYSMSK